VIAANSNVSYSFEGQLTINSLSVSSGRVYELVQNGLADGALVYSDRAYGYGGVPSPLNGATYIKTANDDKSSTGISFMTFNVNQHVSIYVAHDDRISTKPEWLTGFTDSGRDLIIIDQAHSLWKKDFSRGDVTLGGNGGSGKSMYTVIAVAQGTGLSADLTPPSKPTGLAVN
jgi:hypothetical protein